MEFQSSLDHSNNENAENAHLTGHLVFAEGRDLGRQEHTIAGQAIGELRDAFSSGKSLPDGEQIRRAGQNDQIAHIVADTVAFLPSMKMVAAGGIRATLLADPSKGVTDNAFSFGKNFVEGALLNKVGKFAHPESRFAKATQARWGIGLKSELATHAAIGFGMGTVKAGFNPETWTSKEGNISIMGGVGTTLKTGLTASAFSIPAGMIGVRINKAATLAVARGTMSEATGFVIAGAGSGYAGGAVFGGLDGLMHGKSWSEIAQLMHQGGIIGAGTGMFVHGYESLKMHNKIYEVQNRPQREEVTSAASRKPVDSADEIRVVGKSDRKTVEYSEADLTIPVPVRDSHEAIIQQQLEAFRRLGSYQRTTETHKTLAGGIKETETFDSFADFSNRALRDVEVPVREYDVEGHTAKIVVPEEYAAQLDQVRDLRTRANRRGDLYHDGPVQARDAMEARMELASHPLRNRALPEDFIPLLDELPDRSLVKRLMLLGHEDSANRYHEQTEGKGFMAAADASSSGTIRFYKPENRQALAGEMAFKTFEGLARRTEEIVRNNLFHEWAHLLGYKNTEDAYLFELAAVIEAAGDNPYYSRDYAKRQYADSDGIHPGGENWSVHLGEELLHPSTQGMELLSSQAPIRTAMLGRALMRSMVETGPHSRGIHNNTYMNRIGHLNEHVMPKAMDATLRALLSPDRNAQLAAAELLGRIGRTEVVPHLRETALKTRDSEFAARALRSAVEIEGRAGNKDNQLRLLFEVGRDNAAVRQAASEIAWAMDNPAASKYSRLIELTGSTSNLRPLLKLIPKMPDAQGKTLAFGEALRLAREANNGQVALELMKEPPLPELRVEAYDQARSHLAGKTESQTKLDLYALKLFPDLQARALEHLKHSADYGTRDHVLELKGSADAQVRANANEALQAIDRAQAITRLKIQTRTGSEEARIKAVESLAELRESDTVPYLIELNQTSVMPAVRAAAQRALAGFPSNLVSFYRRSFMVKKG